MTKFIAKDEQTTNYLKRRENLKELYRALKRLGTFDKSIEVWLCNDGCEDDFRVQLRVADNQEVIFMFEGLGDINLNTIVRESPYESTKIVFGFSKNNFLSKLKIFQEQKFEDLPNHYRIIKYLSYVGSGVMKYAIVKNGLKYTFITIEDYKFNEAAFRSAIANSESINFRKFVELVKNNLTSPNGKIEYIKFEAEKGNIIVGHTVVQEERTTTFIDEQEGIGHPYTLGKRQK